MHTFNKLIERYKDRPGFAPEGNGPVHATLTAYPGRLSALRLAVESLLNQVDTLHIFLDHFNKIPSFLDHEKVYLTRSQDFGNLGECGKYYWTDDLSGYHFICSDQLVYPEDYAETMKARIEEYGRKVVIGAGGFQLQQPFKSFSESAKRLDEIVAVPVDTTVPVLNDLALAYHSSAIHVSRHYFYQPDLSAFWFSIIALEQQVPLICCRHDRDWLKTAVQPDEKHQAGIEEIDYKSFLVKSYFIDPETKAAVTSYNVNDYFDKIYVMNLDRRPDRWEKIIRIADKYKLDVTRFPAVDGSMEPAKSNWEKYALSAFMSLPEGIEPLVDFTDKFLKYHHYIARIHFLESKLGRKAVQSPGALGYALTYISILKEAIIHDYHRILIFDDDIVLHKFFNEEFDAHARKLPDDWKLVMLGVMQHRWEPYITLLSDMFYHCHGSSVASHAVGIDSKAFLQLLYYSEKLDLPIDEGAIFHIQNVYDKQSFIFLPNLAIQEMNESDINSSAMKKDDIESWMNRFRWNINDYDFDAGTSAPVPEPGPVEIAPMIPDNINTKIDMLKTSVLFAGHDMKFLSRVIRHFEVKNDYRVEVLTYSGHTLTDEEHLLAELPGYDIVFCEWGLGNLKWFSHNKFPGQKLIVRIHAQEFSTSWLSETKWENVDKIIFVGPHMMEKFLKLFPDQKSKCQVVFNLVDTKTFNLQKFKGSSFNLGMLGILPRIKSPHLALEILKELRKADSRYKLLIKSKRPEELDWLRERPEEHAYYQEFFGKINSMGLEDAVVFEPHGKDVAEWFRNIGFILSTSESEAFHLAVAEGMAAGSIPVIRNWEGARTLYPDRLVFNDIPGAVSLILNFSDPDKQKQETKSVKKYCSDRFSVDVLLNEYDKIIMRDFDRKKMRKVIKKLMIDQEQIIEHEKMLATENKKLKADLVSLQETNQQLRTSIVALNESNTRLSTEVASLVESNLNLKNEVASNRAANENLTDENQQLINELVSYRENSLLMQSDLKDLRKELKETQRRYSDVQNSLSWKVGSALVKKPAGIFNKINKKLKS